jgi:hypothetical protein
MSGPNGITRPKNMLYNNELKRDWIANQFRFAPLALWWTPSNHVPGYVGLPLTFRRSVGRPAEEPGANAGVVGEHPAQSLVSWIRVQPLRSVPDVWFALVMMLSYQPALIFTH